MKHWEALTRLAQLEQPKTALVVGPTDTTLEAALHAGAPEVAVVFTEAVDHEVVPSQLNTKDLIRPDFDRKARKVENEVNDIEYILPYLAQRRTVVQAGGAYGLWPLRLAEVFHRVYTFEPHPVNFPILAANTAVTPNIVRMQAALGAGPGLVDVTFTPDRTDNAGAGYVVPGDSAPTLRVDDLGLPDVDLIWLDIEGSEHEALLGAGRTLERCRPVVVIECKQLPQRTEDPFAPVRWLEARKYTRVRDLHRDVMMVPNELLAQHKARDVTLPDQVDLVHIGVQGNEDTVSEAISRGYARLRPGGWITGANFKHHPPDTARAIACHFNLMHIVAGESHTWMFQKPSL